MIDESILINRGHIKRVSKGLSVYVCAIYLLYINILFILLISYYLYSWYRERFLFFTGDCLE